MEMRQNVSDAVGRLREVQNLLDEGFEDCLKLMLELQRQLELRSRQSLRSLSEEDILADLRVVCPDLYRIICNTLFQLIPLLDPDCKGRRVNFYFWPGYHSYLANRRIFIEMESEEQRWNLGVGIYGTPEAKQFNHYHNCSQARWYHYLFGPRNSSEVTPGDLPYWLLLQRPRCPEDPSKYLDSLTVTTDPKVWKEEKLFPEHQVLHLDRDTQDTEGWGDLFSDAVNRNGGTKDPGWRFPDQRGRSLEQENRMRALRSKMQGVWLHAAFANSPPRWLDRFIEHLLSDKETLPAGVALKSALQDRVAADWGDLSQHRSGFASWTTLSLQAWPTPTRASILRSPRDGNEESLKNLTSRTAGSAAFLSSVPLRPRYFTVVRPWLSSIYGLIRNVEISMLLYNREIEAASAAMLAGPYYAHELKKLIDEGLSTALRESSDATPEAVSTRRFVLNSVRAVGNLAYAFNNAFLSRDASAVDQQREEFLRPLRDLYERGWLLAALQCVAEQAYDSVWRGRGARVVFPERRPEDVAVASLKENHHGSCFLLVVEMIRAYCEEMVADSFATWTALLSENDVTILLVGPTRAQRNPATMTFANLDVFLDHLDIGSAKVVWNKDQGTCTYTVNIDRKRAGLD